MKPLELVHYRHCDCWPECKVSVPADMEGPDIFADRMGSEDHLSVQSDKRLTDAELAAEYHASAHEFDMDWAQTGENNRALNERTDALLRFAYFPHYDDEAES